MKPPALRLNIQLPNKKATHKRAGGFFVDIPKWDSFLLLLENQAAMSIRLVLLALWSLLNMVAAGVMSFLTSVFMSIRYDEMHTLSTALDPDPDLTRQTVISNVVVQTAWGLVFVAIVAIVFWLLNHTIYPPASSSRKMGLTVFCICTLILLIGVAAADYYCLSKYPIAA